MLRSREQLELHEDQWLASYAAKSSSSRGREFSEPEHPFRTCFQRDRDRVIHSKAFRRLEYKTQVFVYHEGDHYRTRLTHTMEVAQISRSVARMLGLQEDLAEAICLAHDLGHPPFGHSGQEVIDELMKDKGGFEHNRHSLRLVTMLESRYPQFPGLNLSYEVLEGISKHFKVYDLGDGRTFQRSGCPTLEAQVANLSDEIAYNHHDLDDGLRSGMIDLQQLREVEIWQETFEVVSREFANSDSNVQTQQTIRRLIDKVVTDLIQQSSQNLTTHGINHVEKVRAFEKNLVEFSPEIQRKTVQLKRFLFKNLYRHYRVERMADKAGRILRDLFKAYCHNPKILPFNVQIEIGEGEVERGVCDYIAGMTDRFAMEEHQKLFNAEIRV